MTPNEIEDAINALIRECVAQGGDVWLVDKKQNRYALRLYEEVKIRPFVPSAGKEEK